MFRTLQEITFWSEQKWDYCYIPNFLEYWKNPTLSTLISPELDGVESLLKVCWIGSLIFLSFPSIRWASWVNKNSLTWNIEEHNLYLSNWPITQNHFTPEKKITTGMA